MMADIPSTIQSLRNWITEILEVQKEILAKIKQENASSDLANLLRDYLNRRKAE